MKLTIFLFFLAITQMMAVETYSQSTRLSLNLQSVAVKDVLDQIEQKSEFVFLYNSKLIDADRKVSMDFKDQKISEVLDKLFQETGVVYTVVDRQIVLTNRADQASFLELSNAQQQKSVSGKVTDSSGGSLPGATVVVKGTTTGTITDSNGNFSLSNVPANSTLAFSFVGMKTQEVAFEGKSVINVTLTEDAIGIDEVVAIGYATVEKKSLTGSIADVNVNEVHQRSTSNTITALQGAVPGLIVTRNGGDIGNEGANFQIRGSSSVNAADPLVIVDDIPYSNHFALSSLNPNDIAQISVLKDAAAASIYGARAAGGVILITTKRGNQGKTKVTYSGKVSANYLGLEFKPTTQAEYYNMFDEASVLDGVVDHRFKRLEQWMLHGNNGQPTLPPDIPFFDALDFTYADRHFVDEMYKDFSFSHNHNLNINGGSSKNTYNISLGYVDDEGLQAPAKNNLKRITARLNYDIWLTDRLKASTSVYIENGNLNKPSLMQEDYAMTYPMIANKNINGDVYGFGGTVDPINMMRFGGRDVTKQDKLNTSLKLTYNIMDGFNFISLVGANQWNDVREQNVNIITYYNFDGTQINKLNPNRNSSEKDYSNTLFLNYSAYFNYNKTINKSHNITALLGTSYEKNQFKSFSAWRLDMLTEELHSLQLGDPNEQYNSSSAEAWALGSYFGRLDYNYKHKYLLEVNGRRDGSSRFTNKNRWGNFGGVSGGWVISEEDFFKIPLIDNLKLRASYGVVGHQAGIGLYDYIQLINVNGFYPLGNTPARNITASLGAIASEERTWERIKSVNLGFDFSILKSKLSGSFDYFKKRNDNMLVQVTLPTVLGAIPPTGNYGELSTKGFEVSLLWKDKKGELGYSIGIGISDNKNLISKLAGSNVISLGQITAIEGYPMNSMFGYIRDGLIKTQSELDDYKKLDGVPQNLRIGDAKYRDLNGDGKISVYDDKGKIADAAYLGTNNKRYNVSINVGLNWKNFDFSALFSGWLKDDIIRTDGERLSNWWENQNSFYVGKTFNATSRPNALYPAYSLDNGINNWNYKYQDFLLKNNSFIRLKNITLGYTLPSSFINRIKLGSVRVYFSGDDIWEFANASQDGRDPERDFTSDYPSGTPFMRKISFGVDVNF